MQNTVSFLSGMRWPKRSLVFPQGRMATWPLMSVVATSEGLAYTPATRLLQLFVWVRLLPGGSVIAWSSVRDLRRISRRGVLLELKSGEVVAVGWARTAAIDDLLEIAERAGVSSYS